MNQYEPGRELGRWRGYEPQQGPEPWLKPERWVRGRTLVISVILTAIIAGAFGFVLRGGFDSKSSPAMTPPVAASDQSSSASRAWTPSPPFYNAGPETPDKNITCTYTTHDPTGDDGYRANRVANSDGNPASFSVRTYANRGNTAVHGYPSDQCLMYSALPKHLTSYFQITPPPQSQGLDYEYAYDVWLTSKSRAIGNNWDNDYELMIWNYTIKQQPAGTITHHLSDGSAVWTDSSMVSVVLPQQHKRGRVDIGAIIDQLRHLGILRPSLDGILDVEYGIEAPFGGNKLYTVNSLSVST